MTLLRMLAFRPASESAASGGGGGTVARPAVTAAPRKPAKPVVQASAKPGPVREWAEPDWSALVGQLGLTGTVRLLATNCVYLRREGRTVFLGLDPRSESMLTRQRKDGLGESLSVHFGETLTVDIEVGAATGETPVQEEERMADEKLEAARQSLEADPNVQALKDMFGAELKSDTIELINPSQSEQGNTQ
jgi:DNA polymerase-3 subunit gamma/tau